MNNENNYMDSDKISLALIGTYPQMSKLFVKMTEDEKISSYNAFAAFEDAVVIAKEIEPKVSAILSRGGTAEYIRQAVDIPVITVPITPFDVVQSIYNIPPNIKEVAFFNFKRNIYGIQDIEKMFKKTIHQYTFINRKDIEQGIKDVKARGIKVLIGGDLAVKLAQEEGITGIEISSGEESVYSALQEAIHVVKVRLRERSRSVRLQMAFNSITEGIIVTDDQKQIVICNPSAERIFNLPKDNVIGRNIEDVLPKTRINNVFKTNEAEFDYFQEVNGCIINTNNLPTFLDNKFIGVVSTFEDVTKIQKLEQHIRKKMHAKGFFAKHKFNDIITKNSQMTVIKNLASLYATTKSAILIEGESGTGKELFAQSIHNESSRANGPFVAVNCAAIPDNLLESELFGYESGAFTGAKKEGKQGLFELAHNGTIFLDEIGEIPKSLQTRLLRVIQEKEIMRIGGDKIIPIDIRIISATNKNLEKKVKDGEFRDDLYYRLNVFNIKLPPLRERKDDISLLSTALLKKLNPRVDEKKIQEFMNSLIEYDWPGNIRELHNVMERLSLLTEDSRNKQYLAEVLNQIVVIPSNSIDDLLYINVHVGKGLKEAVKQAEKEIIDTMLNRYNYDQELVADKLGIGRTTLWRKAKIEKV